MLKLMPKLRYFFVTLFFLSLSLLCPAATRAQADEVSRARNQPVKPFRIIGNIYYVGASDVTSYLIVTPQGNILLDSGFVETVPQIKQNIAQLGFRIEDVKVLINGHAHSDHAGGLALLKRTTGAKLMATEPDAALLAAGGKGDFAFGDQFLYQPVKADRILHDGDEVELGGVKMVAHLTPGHTKGNTTWTMKVKEGGKDYNVVFAGSTTAPGYKLVNNAKYPTIADDYARTFRVLKSLPCDVFLAPHGSFFSLKEKSKLLAEGKEPNPFIDPNGYKTFLEETEIEFKRVLAFQSRKLGSDEWVAECAQPERETLMKQAEQQQFTLRRVEFVGLTYTPDKKMRSQMSNFNEGDIFSRAKLSQNLERMNRLQNEIYPVRLTDLMLHLNEPDKTVDITICFRPKRR
jgi:metallo-beta-lactamase class B